MSTQLIEDLGLDNAIPEDDDKAAGGDAVPAGKYHARLVEASEETRGEYTIDKMKFEILCGAHRGKLVPFDLFHTGSDEEKTEKAKARRRSIYGRLGLLTKTEINGKKKYALVPGKSHIRDCLDNDCIIDVECAEEHWTDKKTGAPRKAMRSKVSYWGVLRLDDPAAKDVPRASGARAPVPTPKREPEPDLAGI